MAVAEASARIRLPVASVRSSRAACCEIIHSIPTPPAISRDKPLIVGYNRDEMNFFFAQNRDTDVYALMDTTLKMRLERELGPVGAAVLTADQKSGRTPLRRPVRGDRVGRFAGSGPIVMAEREYAQHGAPVYMYVSRTSPIASFRRATRRSGPRTRGRLSTSSTTSSLLAPDNQDSHRAEEERSPTRGLRACRPPAT